MRSGFALLFSLLMVMALSVVGLGLLALGTREAMIADQVWRRAVARARAEAAAMTVVEEWSTRKYAALDPGEATASLPDTGEGAVVVRLDTALYLVRSVAASHVREIGPPATRSHAALLVRTLVPSTLQRDFPAAAVADGTIEVAGGLVDGRGDCAGERPGVLAPEVATAPDALIMGLPPVVQAPLPAPATPDPFSADLGPDLATLIHDGPSAWPRPVASLGSCTPDSWNWGAIDPSHPCHGLLPFVHADGPLRVPGGVGRGILVVDGDLRLMEDFRFQGIIVVHGRLELDGARITGAVRARDLVVLDGEIRGDGCVISDALAMPALDRAFRPPSRWWLPAL